MPACLVAAVVCATTPALFAGQSDAEKAHSSFMTGGGMFIVDTDVYAVGTIVGTKTHHRERTKFATLRLSPVKTLCLYVRISNFEVDGLKAAFDAQGRCTTPKSEANAASPSPTGGRGPRTGSRRSDCRAARAR